MNAGLLGAGAPVAGSAFTGSAFSGASGLSWGSLSQSGVQAAGASLNECWALVSKAGVTSWQGSGSDAEAAKRKQLLTTAAVLHEEVLALYALVAARDAQVSVIAPHG